MGAVVFGFFLVGLLIWTTDGVYLVFYGIGLFPAVVNCDRQLMRDPRAENRGLLCVCCWHSLATLLDFMLPANACTLDDGFLVAPQACRRCPERPAL